MLRWSGIFAVLMMMALVAPVAMAQDVTPEPVADVVESAPDVVVDAIPTYEERATVTLRDSVMAIVVVVAGAIGAIAVILARTSAKTTALAIEKIYLSVPSYLQPSAATAISAGLDKLGDVAKTTKFVWDDEAIAVLKAELTPVISGQINAQMATYTAELLNQLEARKLAIETP